MTLHNITGSDAFKSWRDRSINGVVRAYPLRGARLWRAVWPSAIGFAALFTIAACLAARFA